MLTVRWEGTFTLVYLVADVALVVPPIDLTWFLRELGVSFVVEVTLIDYYE